LLFANIFLSKAEMLSKFALATVRGGARHKPAPVVDANVLAAVFAKHKSSFADFGLYEHVSVSQACKGKGLVAHYDLLKAMLTLCPSGDMPSSSARTALLTVICSCPEINSSIYNSAVWAGMRCERLGCLLNHLRRLAREPERLKQAAMAMGGSDLAKLKTLISMVNMDSDTGLASGLASGSFSDDDPTIKESPKVRRRLLTKTPSDVSHVSVDSQGFPCMLEGGSSSSASAAAALEPMSTNKNTGSRIAQIRTGSSKKSKTSRVDEIELDEEGYPLLLMEGNKEEEANLLKPAAKNVPAQESACQTWVKMWYKGTSSVGIRRGKGHADKAQIFSLSNREWSQDELKQLGEKCLEKLHGGEGEEEVREWSQAQLGK